MYLSSVPVETGADPNRPRPGRMWISNPYRIHQRLCMAFDGRMPGPEARDRSWFLFRLEGPVRTSVGMRPRLLVQSHIEPDWEAAFRNAPFLICEDPRVRTYHPDHKAGDVLRFRLRVNPTVKRNGKRLGITQTEDQRAWLERKAGEGGFRLVDDRIVSTGWQYSRRSKYLDTETDKDPRRTHLAVNFEGLLKVADAGKFGTTLETGIGSAKAFGFGLLSVAPVS